MSIVPGQPGAAQIQTPTPELSPVKRALQEIRELRARVAELESAAAESAAKPIAIVGVGMRFPGGIVDAASFWNLLAEGRNAITPIPQGRWDWRQYYDSNPSARGSIQSTRGGFLDGIDLFDADFFGIAPREAAMLDPQQRLLHEVAWHALEDACIRPDHLRDTRTGIFLGLSNFDYYRAAVEDDLRIDAYAGSGNSPSMAAGRLAYTLGVHGPAMTVDTSCSSSLVAVHLASQSLRAGEADLALAGGVNVILAPQMHIGFSRAHMLAPDGQCKTFDESANGYVRSEGCAVIILKRLDDAVCDHDSILAVIRGSATNHDGRSGGLTAPSSQAQAALIREALQRSDLTVDAVGMIEAHGTGTSLGDPIEMEALSEVFRTRSSALSPIAVGSVKTNLGHTEAASGMAGLLKAALALHHRQIPRSLHFKKPSPFIPWETLPFQVPVEHRDWELSPGQHRRVAGISSFGFSGSNAHVLLEEFRIDNVSEAVNARSASSSQVAVCSGRTGQALLAARAALLKSLAKTPSADFADLCQTTSRGRTQHPFRVAYVANSSEELQARLAKPQPAPAAASEIPPLCFLFTGQGSEHTGMGLELLDQSGVFRAAVDRLDQAADLPAPISSIWANQAGEQARASLVQPALYAFGFALSELWRAWSIEPRIVLGHSLGEYVAATVAGVMTPEEGIRLVAARGRLTEQRAQAGAMLAVAASRTQIEESLAHLPLGHLLSIAAVNGPSSIVVSGAPEAIEKFEASLGLSQIRCRRLRTTHGFHSAALDPMLDEFQAEADKVQWKLPEVTWVSNLTGRTVDRDRPVGARYWRDHLRKTVEFAAGLQTAQAIGSPLFLELGAEPHLVALADANQLTHSGLVPSLSKSAETGEWHKLLSAAALLYNSGIDLNWDAVADQRPYRKLSLPGYPFERRHHWFNAAAPPQQHFAEPLAVAASAQASMTPMHLDVANLATRQNAIHDWAVALIAATLQSLGCFEDPSHPLDADTLTTHFGVVPAHRRLMHLWLIRLAEEGLLQPSTIKGVTQYHLAPGVNLPDPQQLWLTAESLLLQDQPLRTYLAHCAASLLRVLRGELNALETLFPGGDGTMATALYEQSPGSVYANQIAAAAVAARARSRARTALGFPRRLRILEIGAGTGSTTAAILAQLFPEQVIYTFSDVSDLFLTRARSRFQTHAMEFTLFDLDKSEDAAAHESRYDVVVIANALHAAKDLRASLARVRQILQPGGSLVLVETTAAQAWHDVSTGLIEAWQHFTDDARSNGSPLLPVERWKSELEGAGFESFASAPSSDQPTHALGLHVLLAHKPVASVTAGETETYKAGRASLSTSGQPDSFAALSTHPESPAPASQPSRLVEDLQSASPRQRIALVVEATASAVARILGRPNPPAKDDRLMDIGLDSLMAIELRNDLQTVFALDQLPSTLIFDYPTCASIAGLVLDRLGFAESGPALPAPPPMSAAAAADIHTDAELDAMSTDEIAELLRLQLGQ